MRSTRLGKSLSVLVFALALFTCGRLLAGVTASISGTVTDPSGAVVAGATVTATNVETGVATTLTTNTQGFYSFQSLPLGNYTISVQQSGFKGYSQTGLVLDVNSALVIDVHLEVGATTEKVEVSSDALHVDTESTQMGEVITGKTMTDVPLVTPQLHRFAGFAAGRGADRVANDGCLRWAFYFSGLCGTASFRRLEFRRGIRERHARIGKRVHPEWNSGAGVGIFRRRSDSES